MLFDSINIKKCYSSKLFNDSIWSLVGNIIGRGLSLVAGVIVARFLGKDIYGEFGIIKTTLIYLEIFSTFGLGYTATKYIAEYAHSNEKSVGNISNIAQRITIFTSGIVGAGLLLFADKIAIIIEAPQIVSALQISSIGIVFNAYNSAQIGILCGFSAFKSVAINATLSGILNFLFTIVLTYLYGLNGAVGALVLSYGFQCLFNTISINRILKGYPKSNIIDKELKKEILLFSLPVALQESLFSISNWMVSYILIRYAGYGELGLYTAAGQWGAIIAFIPGILRNVTLSHLAGSKDVQTHSHTIKVMIAVNLFCTIIMSSFIIIASNLICSYYGTTFNGLKSVLIISVLVPIVSSVSNVYVQEFMSVGKNWMVFFCKLLRDIIILILTIIFIKEFKIKGAISLSSVTLIATSLYTLVLFIFYKSRSSKFFEN